MRGSAGDAPEAPEGPAAAPAASDASPTGVNLHTGQRWVDWNSLRSGRYVTVDGGCTEVVNNDGTPARSRTTDAGARLVYGRIELGSDAKRKNITRDKKIKVVGSCVRQGETCAWVAWRFVVAVTDSVVAYNAASSIADSADSSRRSWRQRRTDQRKSTVAESQRADRQPKKRARSRASGGSSSTPALAVDGQNSSPQPGEDAGLSSLLAAATSTSVKLTSSTTTDVSSNVAEKPPGSHWVNRAAVQRAEATVAAASEQVRALERENAELKAKLSAAQLQIKTHESKLLLEDQKRGRHLEQLQRAIMAFDAAAVKRLLEAGADANADAQIQDSYNYGMTGDFESVLGLAASAFTYPDSLDRGTCERISKENMNNFGFREDGSVVKVCEVRKCTIEILELLVAAGAEVDRGTWEVSCFYDLEDSNAGTWQRVWGDTPLIRAARRGCSSGVEWLLNHGANWRITDACGRTALQIAKIELALWNRYKTRCRSNAAESRDGVQNAYAFYRTEYLQVIHLLSTQARKFPFRLNVEEAAHMEMIADQVVLDYLVATVGGTEHESPFDQWQVSYSNDTVVWVKELIRAGANVDAHVLGYCNLNHFSNYGCTAMHVAANWDYLDVMKVLVEADADINATDGRGRTPLLIATGVERTNVVNWLVRRDARWRLAFPRFVPPDQLGEIATTLANLCDTVAKLNTY